ncbi:hypothetical protein BB560_000521 [Smittium megazygosporum]|uniref:glucan endo-1,3-beta-D-glucosidase n=1 Tax=Smittium megazygosporum TaxID=133381 RepID=A0A2T9ZK08_9FUNG|nr:hypothetical protein BB560_000521 [Smittium megazygosporum]
MSILNIVLYFFIFLKINAELAGLVLSEKNEKGECRSFDEIRAYIERFNETITEFRTESISACDIAKKVLDCLKNTKKNVHLEFPATGNQTGFDEDLEELKKIALSNSTKENIAGIIMGSYSTNGINHNEEDQLIEKIKRVKRALKENGMSSVPISVSGQPGIYTPKLVEEIDYISPQVSPYYMGEGLEEAVDDVFNIAITLQNKYPDKRVLLGKVGWPTFGPQIGNATPSIENSYAFMNELYCKSVPAYMPFFWNGMFDHEWNVHDVINNPGIQGVSSWGIINSENGNLKYPDQSVLFKCNIPDQTLYCRIACIKNRFNAPDPNCICPQEDLSQYRPEFLKFSEQIISKDQESGRENSNNVQQHVDSSSKGTQSQNRPYQKNLILLSLIFQAINSLKYIPHTPVICSVNQTAHIPLSKLPGLHVKIPECVTKDGVDKNSEQVSSPEVKNVPSLPSNPAQNGLEQPKAIPNPNEGKPANSTDIVDKESGQKGQTPPAAQKGALEKGPQDLAEQPKEKQDNKEDKPDIANNHPDEKGGQTPESLPVKQAEPSEETSNALNVEPKTPSEVQKFEPSNFDLNMQDMSQKEQQEDHVTPNNPTENQHLNDPNLQQIMPDFLSDQNEEPVPEQQETETHLQLPARLPPQQNIPSPGNLPSSQFQPAALFSLHRLDIPSNSVNDHLPMGLDPNAPNNNQVSNENLVDRISDIVRNQNSINLEC